MDEFDVIVVGAGGTGLMAALTAARLGRTVLLIEKNSTLGGTTRLSVGTICTTCTAHQKAAGIVDTPQEHFEDMAKFAGPLLPRDNLQLRKLLVENVPETFQQLVELGITFIGPIPEPPHRKPRLHAIVPHAKGYIDRLVRACRRLGVTVRTSAPAHKLLKEGGRVIGVEYGSPSGGTITAKARFGIVLASGDFSSASPEYKRRFMSGPLLVLRGINETSTGDGQRLGESVGGTVVNGDLAWGPEIRFLAPPTRSFVTRLPSWPLVGRLVALGMMRLPQPLVRPFLMSFVTTYLAPSHNLFREGAILVNAKGERFCNEWERPQDALANEPEHTGYIIFDEAIASKFETWPNYVSTAPGVGYAYLADYRRSRRDVTHSAPTLAALSEKLGLPSASLEAAVQQVNLERASHPGGECVPLGDGPFYALGPARSWIVFNEGGLRVDEGLRVLDQAGQAIPGLYAAGSCGQGGVILEGHGHHLGWAFTSGRIAGREAAFGPSERNFGKDAELAPAEGVLDAA